MSKVFADKKLVGVWKCTTVIKEVIFNNSNLNFPNKQTKIVSISNTPGGTILIQGQPTPGAKGIPATRAGGIAVEFLYTGKNDQYSLKEIVKINLVDNGKMIGEGTQEWEIPGKGPIAKVITASEYSRIGRMRT